MYLTVIGICATVKVVFDKQAGSYIDNRNGILLAGIQWIRGGERG